MYAEYGVLEEVVQQEVPSQEEQAAAELDGDLPECQDHQPSFFLKGKPRSILLPVVCLYLTYVLFMFDALCYRSCLKPLMHIYYSIFLDYHDISCYPIKSSIYIYIYIYI
jgi:hypothetical protein